MCNKKLVNSLLKYGSKIIVEALGIFFGAYLSFMFIPGHARLDVTNQQETKVSNSGVLPTDTTLRIVSQDTAEPLELTTSSPYARIIPKGNEAFVTIHNLPRGEVVPLKSNTPMTVNIIGSDTATTLGFPFDSYQPSNT